MTTFSFDVAVVGAGPCGLLTALLLARRGVRVGVFERKATPLLHPRAMGVSRRSAEIFQQVGLRSTLAVEDLGGPEFALVLWAESLVGEEYGRTPLPPPTTDVAPYPGFHCPQTRTERALLAALEREDDASIFFDHDVQSLVEKDGAVQLLVHRGRHDQTLVASATFLVAADGAASPVRHWLGIEAEGPGDLGHFLNVHFRADYGPHLAGRRAILSQLLTRESFEVFVAVNGRDEWLMHHFLQAGERPADYPPERLHEIIRRRSGLPDVPVEILGVSPWVMSPRVAAAFRKGRIFLTGDAAARLSPAGGLGMNTGLQSAHNLAWKLAAVLRGAPDRLLDSYDLERREHVRQTFARSNDFGAEVREIIEAGLGGDFARVRELVRSSRRGDSGLALDLGWRYDRGALVPGEGEATPAADGEFHPEAAPGCRAPHCALLRGGGRISTLDLFGAGFALLVAGDAAPWRAVVRPDAMAAGFPVEVFPIGPFEDLRDADGRFAATYGLQPGGAVLVRPDGVVGWRSVSARPEQLDAALATILAGGPAAA